MNTPLNLSFEKKKLSLLQEVLQKNFIKFLVYFVTGTLFGLLLVKSSGGSRILPRWEHQLPKGEQIHEFAILHEIERIWMPRGGGGGYGEAHATIAPFPSSSQMETTTLV